MIRLTGAYPDRDESRERDRCDFNFDDSTFGGTLVHEPDFVQVIRRIHDQPVFGSCCGNTGAACLEAVQAPVDPFISAVSLWRDARRRQGRIEQIELGTRLEYVFESMVERGWDHYVEGEEYDEEEAGKGAAPAGDDLLDEMTADDHRLPRTVKRYRILGIGSAVLDAVDEALRRGWGVGIGTGLTSKFFSHARFPEQPEMVLGLDFMSGDENRHAQRVAGAGRQPNGRRKYLIQNSHGRNFGGCHAPDGTWLRGCIWVDEAVIANTQDRHIVQVVV